MSSNDLVSKIQDPKFYLENFTKIKGKIPGLHPFILNDAQKDLFNTLKVDNRVIILKARQLGFSSAATGWIYHKTITTPGTTSAIVGYNTDLTKELLDKVKTFYSTTPQDLRPTIQYNSKYELTFPKIGSKILILPSTENVGRGYTLHNCLLTELAFWDKQEEKMTAIENSVPRNGKIIVESTPNGVGDLYHKMWVTENAYKKKEYGWWWGYTEEEIEEIRGRMNDPRRFAQEYGLEFLASGRPVFDQRSVHKQRENVLRLGDIHPETKEAVFEYEGLRVYRKPEPGGMYVLGADVSEGVTGGDYSALTMFNRLTGEEVAFFRGYIAPDKFGEMIDRWGRWYNNALAVVEVNNHGLTTVTILKQKLYPSLYFRPSRFDAVASAWSDKLGWKTTVMTRPLMIDDIGQALRDGTLIIHSKEILDEMNVFIYDKGNNMTAQEGFHDDGIFSLAVCYQGFKVLYDKPLDQIDYTQHLPSSHSY